MNDLFSEYSYTRKQDDLYRMASSDLAIQKSLTEKNQNGISESNHCISNYSKAPESFLLAESEREKGSTMSKMIRKIEAFNTEFKKPEFSRNSRNQELSEEVYSSEEENSYIITEEAKSQIILNGSNESPAQKNFNSSKSMKEPNQSSPVVPKKVFFKGRASKVISFGTGFNHKEFLNQTITKTGGKDREGEENEENEMDEEEEKVEKKDEPKNEKEKEPKNEESKLGWKQEEDQVKKNCLSPSCYLSPDPESENKPALETEISGLSKTLQKSLYHLISDFYIVKKFIWTIRDATIYRSPKRLKGHHFKMINDWSFFREGWGKGVKEETDEKKNNFYRTSMSTLTLISKKISLFLYLANLPIFHPTHTFRIFWDLINLALVILLLFVIPINVFFEVDLMEGWGETKKAVGLFFLADGLVNLNTAYYSKGELIKKRDSIFKNYIRNYFLWDFISILPLLTKSFVAPNIFQLFSFDRFLGLTFLIRIANVNRITSRLEEFILIDDRVFNILSLFKLLSSILFISHIFACIWNYIANINLDSKSWLSVNDLTFEPWHKRYLNAYYFVVVVMNTVGFGDLTPQNDYERLYCVGFIYVACGIFAYTINCVGVIVQDINKTNKLYKRNLHLINGYMQQKKIRFDLRIKVRKYFEYIWNEEKDHNEEETLEIINRLSKTLKSELLFESNGKILEQLPLFSTNFCKETLRKLVYIMKEISFTPGETIYNRLDLEDDPVLFILRKGEVELFVETPKFLDPITVTKKLRQNEIFGEIAFFGGSKRETSARSSSFCNLFAIRLSEFMAVVKCNRDDYQNFCQLKDKINLYGKRENLFSKCSGCGDRNHNTVECQTMHLVLSKERILAKYNHSKPQVRVLEFSRKARGKTNCRKLFTANMNGVKKLSLLINESLDEGDEESGDGDSESNEEMAELKRDLVKRITSENIEILNVDDIDTSPKFKDSETSSLHSKNKKNNERLQINELSSINSPVSPNRNTRFRKNMTMAVPAPFYNKQFSKDNVSTSKLSKVPTKMELTNRSRQKSRHPTPRLSGLLRGMSSLFSINKAKDESYLLELSDFLKSEKNLKSDTSSNLRDMILHPGDQKLKTEVEKMRSEKSNEQMENCDMLKSYEVYFPHNNIENILQNMELLRKAKKSKHNRKNRIKKMSSKTGFKYGELVTPEEKNQIIKILKENEKKLNRMRSRKTRFFMKNKEFVKKKTIKTLRTKK